MARGFAGSQAYWEDRYASGGSSGKGSYGRLAEFKARTLNDFVRQNDISSVIEFGCGDGNQLALAEYPHYLGCDVSSTAIDLCSRRFRDDPTKAFQLLSEHRGEKAELAISLDVIYHLIEDSIYEDYMFRLFNSAERYVIVYSTDFDRLPGGRALHVRHRKFTTWVEERVPNFAFVRRIDNVYGPGSASSDGERSPCNFYVFQAH